MGQPKPCVRSLIMNKKIIVCKFQENTGWVNDLPKDWDVTIVTKNNDLPNIGRDPTSILYAIIHNYDNIEDDDIWLFLQGYPFDHYANLINYLNDFDPTKLVDYIPLNDAGGMNFYDTNYANLAKKWWGIDFNSEWFFYGSCQFLVTGKAIKKYSNKSYQSCYEDIMMNESLMYCQERLFTPMYNSL